jgi:ATP-dependent Clp protease ATP-binding subunit ClpA
VRVTEPAQSAVHYAKQEAGRLGHDRVGTEHLLLGLLRDQECLAVATLGGLGIAPETVRRRGEETAIGGDLKPALVTTQSDGRGHSAVSCMGFLLGAWVP